MKRNTVIVIILLTVISLTILGDRILARILDQELPPLLTRELGLPVHLDPLKANIFSLTATTPRLVMGPADTPAVVATQVEVSLNWSDLLRGEIRLITARGEDLTLQLSNWPTSGDPWPTDYSFLDPWLPNELYLAQGRYLDKADSPYPVQQALWQRGPEGASVAWQEERLGSQIQMNAKLDSLARLLQLQAIKLDLDITKDGKPESTIAIKSSLSPAAQGGYELDLTTTAAGAEAHTSAGNNTPWELPSFSTTTVNLLQIEDVKALVSVYRENAQPLGGDAKNFKAPLPQPYLPEHSGTVTIADIRFRDELGKDTRFDFTTDASSVKVRNLSSNGPRGVLQGSFDMDVSPDGWKVDLDAVMQAADADKTLAPDYTNADWIWQTGHARVLGQGAHWQELLGSLEGDIDLKGYHRGKIHTPVSISALLDKMTGDFALDKLEVKLGEGVITGKVRLVEKDRPLLTAKLQGENLDLGFLFEDDAAPTEPGVTIPEYLGFLPSLDIDGSVEVSGLTTPAFQLASTGIALDRTPQGGSLTVTAAGVQGGSLELEMVVDATDGLSRKVDLKTKLVDMDLSELFQQDMRLYSRSTGEINFSGTGSGITNMFNTMRGKARLSTDFRRDNNWDRKQVKEETLEIVADAGLIIEGRQIVGLELDNVDIDSIKQNVSARLTMRADTQPWLTADVVAEKLDIDGLVDLLPETTEEADRTDLLPFLKELGNAKLSLKAQALQYSQQELQDLTLIVSSEKDKFVIDKLDFTLEGNPLTSDGGLTWQEQTAALTANIKVSNFDIDRFLIPTRKTESVPVSGKINLESEGESFVQLLSNVTGRVSLAGAEQGAGVPADKQRRVEINAKRKRDGIHADVSEFVWGQNSFKGSLLYRQGARPSFDVSIDSGTLNLEPWEKALDEQEPAKVAKDGSLLGSTAKTSAKLVNDILSAPLRMFSGPREADPGKKLFDNDPLPFETLQGYDARIEGRLTRLVSRTGNIAGVHVDGGIEKGKLSLKARADSFNGGPGNIQIDLDTLATPATVTFLLNFEDILTADGKPTFPRSGFINLSSTGHTTSQLAAMLNGEIYLELGEGPFEYTSVSLFTADLATRVATTLIPGIEKSQPMLECGIVLGTFEDGVGDTPVGYTLRTERANLIGRMNVDLKKETMELAVDSRSREGVGLAVGNVFSNTIRIRGPLTDPDIVPHTTGILWRGWAAFMTAGLSVVGESVLKRAMAAENPCKSIKKDIRKEVCGTGRALAQSPLVCP